MEEKLVFTFHALSLKIHSLFNPKIGREGGEGEGDGEGVGLGEREGGRGSGEGGGGGGRGSGERGRERRRKIERCEMERQMLL